MSVEPEPRSLLDRHPLKTTFVLGATVAAIVGYILYPHFVAYFFH